MERLFIDIRATLLAAAVWLSGNAINAQEHPCRSILVASGNPVNGSTVSSFQLEGSPTRIKLDGLLVSERDLALPQITSPNLYATKEETDRYGRIAIQAISLHDGEWLQGRILRQGLAFRYAIGVEAACLDEMLKSENVARNAKIGLWTATSPVFDTSKPDDLLQHIGEFVIVTGIVKSIGDTKRRLYLNFGSNWAEDVTATVLKKGSSAYWGDVAVLQRLEGKRVGIRGIVEDAQGPLIRLIDEAQIDILSR